jgi:hypothetical protein
LSIYRKDDPPPSRRRWFLVGPSSSPFCRYIFSAIFYGASPSHRRAPIFPTTPLPTVRKREKIERKKKKKAGHLFFFYFSNPTERGKAIARHSRHSVRRAASCGPNRSYGRFALLYSYIHLFHYYYLVCVCFTWCVCVCCD